MKRLVFVGLMLLGACAPKTDPEPKGELAWAYPVGTTSGLVPPAGEGPFTVPGSQHAFSKTRIYDDKNPVDWFPDAHPVPPAVVNHQSGSGPTPCAECHGYQGEGSVNTPELNGLSADYIVEQVRAFRSGERRSAQADRGATAEMIKVANAVSDDDLRQAAAYFAGLPHKTHRRVVEAALVPVTQVSKWGFLYVAPGGAHEPIDNRVIEVSDDLPHAFLDDHQIGFTVYAPVGAVARGKALVENSAQPCTTCHGADLRGVGNVPALAGRSPPYLARMLWDIKTGARRGPSVALMQAPVRDLTPSQIADITAYIASRKP